MIIGIGLKAMLKILTARYFANIDLMALSRQALFIILEYGPGAISLYYIIRCSETY